MPRDPRKLRVFTMADNLVPLLYKMTSSFPADERFGLVTQMRRAAVSIPANIVEGCGRRSTADYLRFLNIATGSAYELGYLCGLSARLGIAKTQEAEELQTACSQIAAGLTSLIDSLEHADSAGGEGRAREAETRKP